MTLRVLDLFSGIGGFSLGLERTGGFETVAFCEIEEFPRRVLAKHWPGVPIYHDVRELSRARLAADGLADIDVICGGFPCQDISLAGGRDGLDGAHSGLWRELARLVGELRPRFVLVENTAGLLSLGMGSVLGDLAALGYDTEWHCIPASAIGAPHVRDRVWIIAHPDGQGEHAGAVDAEVAGVSPAVPDAGGLGLSERSRILTRGQVADAAATASGQWDDLPDVGRAVHGLSNRMDRIRALGNAVIPQIPELIGRAILAAERLAA